MAMDKKQLLARLQGFLPPECLIYDQDTLRPYECDGLSAYRQVPMLVVLPETVKQVQTVMALCHEHRIPVVARGAATGLSGGALPLANGVLLGMSKFNRVLDINPTLRTARVQPGVSNQTISEQAKAHGLYYAPDPSSQIVCTIGGNVAENSGGVHCLKYGLTVHNILELTVILANGELVTIGGQTLDNSGYDLLALMTGSEGMLGIVVEVLVKLLVKPECTRMLLVAFDDVQKAATAVGKLIIQGIIPAGLEMMDNLAITAVEDHTASGYPRDAQAILLCEIDGSLQEVEQEFKQAKAIFIQSGATKVHVAKDEQERLLLWQGRKSAFPAVGRISPDYYCMDGTVPRNRLAEVLSVIGELSKKYQLRVANVFHAGDGNLHPLILYDANKPGELQKAEKLGAEILELSVRVGGCITGEHGVGYEKLHQMHVQFNEDELAQFRAIKQAFDPRQILNPGKVIPQPRRCAEYKTLSRQGHG